MSEQFKDAMTAWVALKKQLVTIRTDMKVLVTQEKQLREFIQGFMRDQKINACTVSEENAKVTYSTRVTKKTFNKELVRKALHKYFRGDETLVARIFELIDEEASSTSEEKSSISLKNVKP
jgi:hypothetical protein